MIKYLLYNLIETTFKIKIILFYSYFMLVRNNVSCFLSFKIIDLFLLYGLIFILINNFFSIFLLSLLAYMLL